MSENHNDCQLLEDLLLAGASENDLHAWQPHLESCEDCREQLQAHRVLVATFSEEAVPQLSPAFDAGLQRKLVATVKIQPLEGWRMVAMVGYALIAVLLVGWALARLPLPSMDPSSPWTFGAAIAAVPLTLWLTIAATRWLPPIGRNSSTRLGLL